MTRIHSKSAPLNREDVHDQIEAMLKLLPVPTCRYDLAYLEHNKLILIEDFEVEDDENLRNFIMAYVPEVPEIKAPDSAPEDSGQD